MFTSTTIVNRNNINGPDKLLLHKPKFISIYNKRYGKIILPPSLEIRFLIMFWVVLERFAPFIFGHKLSITVLINNINKGETQSLLSINNKSQLHHS